ncbi:MAG: hypothetical protein HYW71_01070 [Candidatus Niyogibacteria bacterium]|nr:hypothetical protein [Candidatus Niyogibacteria bacterium]
MFFFLILIIVSFFGILTTIFRHWPRVRSLPPEEISSVLAGSRSFLDGFIFGFLIPSFRRVQSSCVPIFYVTSEKTVRRSRLLILKIESRLQKITDHLKGRRILNVQNKNNGRNYEYWQEINEHQNGLKEEIKEGEKPKPR